MKRIERIPFDSNMSEISLALYFFFIIHMTIFNAAWRDEAEQQQKIYFLPKWPYWPFSYLFFVGIFFVDMREPLNALLLLNFFNILFFLLLSKMLYGSISTSHTNMCVFVCSPLLFLLYFCVIVNSRNLNNIIVGSVRTILWVSLNSLF